MSDSTDVAQMLFSNILLLGFDPAGMEAKFRIPFDKNMFNVPNKKAFECVSQFLFARLDPAKTRDAFRDCWPIREKKDEQTFRKVCSDWLLQITKDDPACRLPLVAPSMLTKPGGEKFTQFMFYFSAFVLSRVGAEENKNKVRRELVGYPVLTAKNELSGAVVLRVLSAEAVRQQRLLLNNTARTVATQEQWYQHADQLVDDYRLSSKLLREQENELKTEKALLTELSAAANANSSPSKSRRRSSGSGCGDVDLQAVKRGDRIRRVRKAWNVLEGFSVALQSYDRGVIESVLRGTVDACRMDATQLDLSVSHQLLRDCREQLQQRNVDSIYRDSKLNLVNLLHVWNLSLQLYIKKLQEVGVPNVTDTLLPETVAMLQTHQTHLVDSEALRQQLELNVLPELKSSIQTLRQDLDRMLPFLDKSPASIRQQPCGFGLLPATPVASFDAADSPTLAKASSALRGLSHVLKPHNSQGSTPEIVAMLKSAVDAKMAERRRLAVDPLADHKTLSDLPKDHSSRLQGTETAGQHTASSTGIHTAVSMQRPRQAVPLTAQNAPDTNPGFTRAPASVLGRGLGQSGQRGPVRVKEFGSSRPELSGMKNARPIGNVATVKPAFTKDISMTKPSSHVRPKADGHSDASALKVKPTSRHEDILIDRIVSAVMSDSPEAGNTASGDLDFIAEFDPIAELDHQHAFGSADLLQRTPPTPDGATRHKWHDAGMGEGRDDGQLASMLMLDKKTSTPRQPGERDTVAVKLFSLGNLDSQQKGQIFARSPFHKYDADKYSGLGSAVSDARLGRETLLSLSGTHTPSSIQSLSPSPPGGTHTANVLQTKGADFTTPMRYRRSDLDSPCESKGVNTVNDAWSSEKLDVEKEGLWEGLDGEHLTFDGHTEGSMDGETCRDEVVSLDETMRLLLETATPRLPARLRSTESWTKPTFSIPTMRETNRASVLVHPVAEDDNADSNELIGYRRETDKTKMKILTGTILHKSGSMPFPVDDSVSGLHSEGLCSSSNLQGPLFGEDAQQEDFKFSTRKSDHDYVGIGHQGDGDSFDDLGLTGNNLAVVKGFGAEKAVAPFRTDVDFSRDHITHEQFRSHSESVHTKYTGDNLANVENDVASIIARFNSLRSHSLQTPGDASTLPRFSLAVPGEVATDSAFVSNRRLALGDAIVRPDPFASDRVATRTVHLAGTPERGLDDEGFDDIHKMMLDVSAESPYLRTPEDFKVRRLSRFSGGASIEMSPLTEAVHSHDVTPLHRSTAIDLFNESGSCILPISPISSPRTDTVPTANLIDLS